MTRRPLYYITREKEQELINKLLFLVDSSKFNPSNTAIIMASPDYSATVAMHLAHAWSQCGEIIPIIPVEVPYPDESSNSYIKKMHHDLEWYKVDGKLPFDNLVMVEAGIIRGSNWRWLLDEFGKLGFKREDITLVSMTENIHSQVKSDVVSEYYNDETHELVFYYERFNNHWAIR